MKEIRLLFAVSGMTLIGACTPLKVDQMPSRTPTAFLLDIKELADSDDLTNVDAVAKQLRIDLARGPEKPVYIDDGKTLLGYGVEVKEKGMAREYTPDNFHYGIFTPESRRFNRVLISISVNSEVICVTPADLMEVFGEVTRSINAHTSSIGYSYENARIKNFREYFNFEQYGCLYKFGFFKNRNKE